MRNRNRTETSPEPRPSFDFDADRYPTGVSALRRLIEEGDALDGQVEWIEVHAQANGEVTYRVRAPRAEELEGGHLAAPGS